MFRQAWAAQLAVRTGAWFVPLLLVACGTSAQEESRVKTVEARIDGLICPTCVAPLTASLRRHFDKALAVDVDDEHDTATVRFDAGQEFSAAAFHEAATQVRMAVREFRIQACRRIEANGNERWLVAGRNRFLVHSDRDMPVDVPLCLDGSFDSRQDPATLEVSTFELQVVS
jgi:hypothetical protein